MDRINKMFKRVCGLSRRTWSSVMSRCFGLPRWVLRNSVWLPCKHPLIASNIAEDIFRGNYESKELKLIGSNLDVTDVVLELGSGIGCVSSFCSLVIGSDRVHTVEANPLLLPLIHETFKKNNVSPVLHNVFLGKGEGVEVFYVSKNFWESSSVVISSDMTKIEVSRVDVNRKLAEIGPSFLIVDIEGGEGEFFEYADLTTVRKICLETHEDVIGDAAISRVFRRLFDMGFVLNFKIVFRNVYFFYR